MDTKKISLYNKVLYIFFWRKKYKNKILECSFFFEFILHLLNSIFIFGGWIFILDYFHKFWETFIGYKMLNYGFVSFLSIISWLLFNLLYIYLIPCRAEEKHRS